MPYNSKKMKNKTAQCKELIQIVETGVTNEVRTPSLEVQMQAVLALSQLHTDSADDYLLSLEKYLNHTDETRPQNEYGYTEIFEFPNAKGPLYKKLRYSVVVNDSAPSPDDWGRLYGPEGEIIRKLIEDIKKKRAR